MTKNQINVQDQFLNRIRRDRTPVVIEFTSGQKIEGVIISFDNFSLILRGESDRLVYKHAIASIALSGRLEFVENK